jgi:hypothetical protein
VASLLALALALGGCGAAKETSPAETGTGPSSADAFIAAACRHQRPPRTLVLALEADRDRLSGVRYFVSEWSRLGCLRGRTVSADLAALRSPSYDVLVVDVNEDRPVTRPEAAAISGVAARGVPVAVFAEPGVTASRSPSPEAQSALAGIFPGLRFTLPLSTDARELCSAVHFGSALPAHPFDLNGVTLFYESPLFAVFEVSFPPDGDAVGAETLATEANCTPGAPTVMRRGNVVVAGFSLGYEVARADNNEPTLLTKEAMVDVVDGLGATPAHS